MSGPFGLRQDADDQIWACSCDIVGFTISIIFKTKMAGYSRRDFLKAIAAATVAGIASRGFARGFGQDSTPFEFLVLGDSLMWGQGLQEADKFYSLTAEWLRKDAFGSPREVNLRVKAHSGSSLKFHAEEAEKFRKAGRSETTGYEPEVNVGFPSIWKQIEMASGEYKAAGSAGADLVMLCGGITDITTARVFDPKGDDDKLKAEIKRYCQDDMFDVIDLAAKNNPRAKIVVVGYYPVITTHSTGSKVLNAWLEALSFPRALKFVPNNPLVRPMFFNRIKRRAIVRSQIWLDESNKNFQLAVDRLNKAHGSTRAVFVRSPLTEENGVEAPRTKLFRMGKGGVVKDTLASDRIKACRRSLPELKSTTGIAYSVRLCEIAAIGHPDQAGARAYAEAIRSVLPTLLK